MSAETPISLQFDVATPVAGNGTIAGSSGVICRNCQEQLAAEYYDVNGASFCERCRERLVRQIETPTGWGVLVRALVFGLAAAVAGAVVYYAVIALTDFEIGIVAIAIGYMVGYSIRRATAQRGGRRFQILAVALTYWAVGLAYTPLVLNGTAEGARSEAIAGPASTSADAATVGRDTASGGGFIMAAALVLGLTFALPVMFVLGSLPGGAISAAIIGFGMHQAWKMTGVPHVVITGPYQIGASTAPVA